MKLTFLRNLKKGLRSVERFLNALVDEVVEEKYLLF